MSPRVSSTRSYKLYVGSSSLPLFSRWCVLLPSSYDSSSSTQNGPLDSRSCNVELLGSRIHSDRSHQFWVLLKIGLMVQWTSLFGSRKIWILRGWALNPFGLTLYPSFRTLVFSLFKLLVLNCRGGIFFGEVWKPILGSKIFFFV